MDWTSRAETLLKAISAPELDPLFWRSDRSGVDSAWYGHVPFAHWLVRALEPRCIVELGTHHGVSYAAFCRAVQRLRLGTRCFAVDTWQGDDHAGLYGEEVFSDFRTYHDERFAAFSTLLRSTFDEALEMIPDHSVDLLHIDGRHGFEDVRHDYERWRSKMSKRCVVLFHDTKVRENGFGVWRFWSELQQDFPSFEFLHGYGLGVLAVGSECPALVTALTGLGSSSAAGTVRERFSQLGERCILEAQTKLLAQLLGERSRQRDAGLAHAEALQAELAVCQTDLQALRNDLTVAQTALTYAEGETERTEAQQRRAIAAEQALGRILQSSTWRATWPLRAGFARMPPWLRRLARGTARLAWRTLTPHLKAARQAALVAHRPLAVLPVPPPLALGAPNAAAAADVNRMPVVCYVSGEPDTPGTIYRVERYAASCRAAGARVTVLRLDKVASHMADAVRADIVVIWRAPWGDALAAFVHEARVNGARIVFDVDDLMIDPALGTIEIIDGIRSQNVAETAVQALYTTMQSTMFAADYCSASTAELAGHMRRFGKIGFALPNGFDLETFEVSRMAVRRRRASASDGMVRLGYASGSRTHQRDFAEIASILPNVLRAHPECRLVLFRAPGNVSMVEIEEFPQLRPFAKQIEWRDLVPLRQLPEEIARFDINLAPLQLGNVFCGAKSELKYFEGALAGVCTVASPVGPYARAIQHGRNGFLAATPARWEAILLQLLEDPALRQTIAQTALNDVLWTYGPDRRAQLMRRMLAAWQGGPAAADAFVLEQGRRKHSAPPRRSRSGGGYGVQCRPHAAGAGHGRRSALQLCSHAG